MSTEMERIVVTADADESALKPSSLSLTAGCSTTSSPTDTPGDSGVLCLDSESDLTSSGVLMTTSLAGAEELACDPAAALMTRSDIDNRNVAEDAVPELLAATAATCSLYDNLPDVVLKALESEKCGTRAKGKVREPERQRIGEPKKSLSEDIVFRRKCKKKQGTQGTQKKRVSFHEDILNNTKTDNIHIEHGFVSYNPGGSYCDRFRTKNYNNERFSWCASGDKGQKMAADIGQQTMSDIIGYNDKSGIFEYVNDSPSHEANDSSDPTNSRKNSYDDHDVERKGDLYGCESNSSDSNLSCQSESSSSESTSSNSHDNSSTSQKCDKTQKSYSCDCFENDARKTFMRRMYFSEADIDQAPESSKRPLHMEQPMSQSPGTVKSALKKKRYIPTNVIEEHKKATKKGLNILPQNNIFNSFKNFYKTLNFNLSPEKGLPEGTEDSTTVVEAMPCEVKPKFLSKSLDSGFHVDDEDEFVEINLNEQTSQNEITIRYAETPDSLTSSCTRKYTNLSREESPRQRLTLNMNTKHGEESLGMKRDNTVEAFPENTKYVVNCESMVYEHKGVSYCYMHDSFQTTFDAPKELFVPIPEIPDKEPPKITVENETAPLSPKNPAPERVASLEKKSEGTDKTCTPKSQFNKSLQDETDTKTGVSKHLASPKKQNVSRYDYKASTSSSHREDINCNITETYSNGDNSTLKGGDETAEEILDVPPDPTFQRDITNKSALLNRYLKNVCQKKDLEMKIRNNAFFQKKLKLENKFPNLVYPKDIVSKHFREGAAKVCYLIDKEIIENKRVSVRLLTANEPSYFDSFEDNVAMECSEKLRLQIFTQPSETLHRMLKVRSPYNLDDGSWRPLLVFITDYALYVAEVKQGRSEYNIVCRLPHNQLDAIAVGPDSQYVRVVARGGRAACSLVTGEPALALRLASSLEWAARTSPCRPLIPPACLPLSAGTARLASCIARQRQTERAGIWFYGQVCSGEANGSENDAKSSGPPQIDGYLMYKPDAKKRWEPAYFLLRSGVLSWGPHSPDSSSAPLPHRLPLGSVLGVRRYCDSLQRPHCFELALARSRTLLAAPDEPTASAWLQALLQHAAQCLHDNKQVSKTAPVKTCGGPPAAFTVLVTATEVLSVRESLDLAFVVGAAPYLHDKGAHTLLREYLEQLRTDVEILACGSIKNLTAFKIPNNDENWCVLEWSVCEARERDAGLALVFASGAELERFISAVEHAFCALTSSAFPLSVVDGEGTACGAAHARYDSAWAHMLPAH